MSLYKLSEYIKQAYTPQHLYSDMYLLLYDNENGKPNS